MKVTPDPRTTLINELVLQVNDRLHELESKRVAASKDGDHRMMAYFSGARDQLCIFIEQFVRGYDQTYHVTDEYHNQRWIP